MKKIYAILCMVIIFNIFIPVYNPSVKASGTIYYVSADGRSSNDGLSPDTPIPLTTANGIVLNGGDLMLFKRGDTFYGSFKPITSNTSSSNRVTISSYGSGSLPVISMAKIISKKWTPTGNFFSYNIGGSGVYGGIESDNCNIGFMEDKNGKKWGVRRENASTCMNDYDFYCSGNNIYVKSSREPYTLLGPLILGIDGRTVQISSNTNVSELHLKYGGYGFIQASRGSENITITDCVIEDMGGNKLGNTGFVKAGNGIEFFNDARNILIERNIIRNCYDVGFTLQGNDSIWTNVTVKNNILAYNTQAFEFWTGPELTAAAGTGVNGCNITGNICINQGEGWGTAARPDRIGGGGQVCSTDLLAYGYHAPICNITITGNAFYNRNKENRIYSVPSTGVDVFEKSTINNNMLYFSKIDSIIASTDKVKGVYGGDIHMTFAQWQDKYGHDKNGTFTAIDGQSAKYANMESLAATSTNFFKLYDAVRASGINISISKPSSYIDPETGTSPYGNTGTTTSSGTAASSGTSVSSSSSASRPSSASSSSNTTRGDTENMTDRTSEDMTDSEESSEEASETDNTEADDGEKSSEVNKNESGNTSSSEGTSGKKPSSSGIIIVIIAVVIVLLAAGAALVYIFIIKNKR